MIEETLKFTDPGDHKKYEWEIVHNLDEFNLELSDFFMLFQKNFPQFLTDKNQFCMFAMVNAKQKHPTAKCFPKDVINDVMSQFN